MNSATKYITRNRTRTPTQNFNISHKFHPDAGRINALSEPVVLFRTAPKAPEQTPDAKRNLRNVCFLLYRPTVCMDECCDAFHREGGVLASRGRVTLQWDRGAEGRGRAALMWWPHIGDPPSRQVSKSEEEQTVFTFFM